MPLKLANAIVRQNLGAEGWGDEHCALLFEAQ
ncbi:hypothetical protein VSP9026_00177 [Vibrio spartinae]|uniref:Uncharacterized protein n=1 Tax=Vibrio spartinae TaxID=1918945 RepID=A0A1N6LZF0_9VIBR|nr:hypothetical protein VSP9026_00177 [Vibrio spartinae]